MPFGRDAPRSLDFILAQLIRKIRLPHSAQLLNESERAISRERLKRYLTATSQSLSDAVSLYELSRAEQNQAIEAE
jgi:hypothetical protein